MKKSEFIGGGAAIILAAILTVFEVNFNSVNFQKYDQTVSEQAVINETEATSITETTELSSESTYGEETDKHEELIDLSTAEAGELCELDGIGEKTAMLIIDYRNKNGGFSEINDLLNIKGIGENTIEKLKDFVYISDPIEKVSESEAVENDETSETEIIVAFPIDLSTAGIEELTAIDGIGEKTATLIIDYRNKNGGFSEINDLLNIKGIGENTIEKLKDFVYISDPIEKVSEPEFNETQTDTGEDITDITDSIIFPININTAGIEELTALDGIGEKTAKKIIDYRNTYGNFKTISDIMNVSGIGEKKFESIKDKIYVEMTENTQESAPSETNLININTADIDELMTLKGIGEKKAQNIIDYRNEHGKFKDKTDLLNVKGISEKIFEQIASFICV